MCTPSYIHAQYDIVFSVINLKKKNKKIQIIKCQKMPKKLPFSNKSRNNKGGNKIVGGRRLIEYFADLDYNAVSSVECRYTII